MDEMKVRQICNGQSLHLEIAGAITVTAQFPNIPNSNFKEVVIDLEKVTYINSFGVRRWMLWNWNLEKDFAQTRLFFDRIPALLVRQTAIIKEFFPKQAIARSVYVSYFCTPCDELVDKLFDLAGELKTRDTKTMVQALQATVSCPRCQKPMALDSVPEHYFPLITDQAEAS